MSSILDMITGQGLSPEEFDARFVGQQGALPNYDDVDDRFRQFVLSSPTADAPPPEDRMPPKARPMSGAGVPVNVPLPRPRPAEASPIMTPDVMSAVDQFAPTDVQRAARGQPPIPQTGGAMSMLPDGMQGGLASMVSGPGMATFARSLAAGLKGMRNSPFKGQAFASGAGAAMEGGQNYEDQQQAIKTARGDKDYQRRLQALDRLLKLKTVGSQDEFNKARTEYYRSFADTRRQDADTRSRDAARKGSATRPEAKTILESERLIGAREKQAAAAIDRVRNDFNLTPEQKQARIAEIEQARDAYGPGLRQRLGVDKAEGPAEINMQGQGTREAPYAPQSAEDYQNIEPGTYYVHPSDGKLRLKK